MQKPLKLLVFLLFIPLLFHAQKTLTGLWTGTLSNDSNTIRKSQSFEIALTEYRGKVYGYSRMNFFVNDTLYYIVKRVKGSIENGICEVKDDEIVTHNFPRHPDKGVKLISTFRRSFEDSIWRLDGDWKTTESKRHRYYSISGKISLTSEPDLSKSKIFPHLEELDLAKDVAFYNESKKKTEDALAAEKQRSSDIHNNTVASVNKENKQPSEIQNHTSSLASVNASPELKDKKDNTFISETTQSAETSAAFTGIKKSTLPASHAPIEQKKDINGNMAGPEIKNPGATVKVNEIMPADNEPKEEMKNRDLALLAKSGESSKTIANDLSTPVIKKQAPAVKVNDISPASAEPKEETGKADPATATKSNLPGKIIANDVPKPEFKIPAAAAFVGQRKTIVPQILEFKSDSLELKLYDNGEIDGDTVSILLNGEILLAKQGLKASAIKKTIYIPPGSDEITLVLYAENLGKYPPNTGLVIIRDGENDYQVRFSADLQQNAAITLRRKK